MEIFNIGPLELIIVLLIMFLLLGPREMILTAQRIGQWIRRFVRSPMWREIMGYSQEIRELPQKLMDDTGLKEALDDVKQQTQQTANELNSTVREAVQDARVPEAEHLKIETGAENKLVEGVKLPTPATTAVPAVIPVAEAVPASPGRADAPAPGETPTDDGPSGEAQPAAEELPAADNLPAAVLDTAETAGTTKVDPVESPAAPSPRRGRPRKTDRAAEETPGGDPAPEIVAQAGSAVEAVETSKPRRGRPRKTTGAQAGELATGTVTGQPAKPVETGISGETAGAAQVNPEVAEAPKPRRGRSRKASPVDDEPGRAETEGEKPRRGRPRKDATESRGARAYIAGQEALSGSGPQQPGLEPPPGNGAGPTRAAAPAEEPTPEAAPEEANHLDA